MFESGRYPIDVYPVAVRNFLTFLVPIAFVTTLPARALSHGVEISDLALSILLAAAMTLVSGWFWRVGLRRYGSASS